MSDSGLRQHQRTSVYSICTNTQSKCCLENRHAVCPLFTVCSARDHAVSCLVLNPALANRVKNWLYRVAPN